MGVQLLTPKLRSLLSTETFEVTLWRPATSGWWWSLRHENATDPIERSGHAFPTRREARDAAWKALRRLIADAAKKGGSR